MAFLRDLPKPRCKGFACVARASQELLNRFSASMGFYCARCGKRALRDLDLAEAASDLADSTRTRGGDP